MASDSEHASPVAGTPAEGSTSRLVATLRTPLFGWLLASNLVVFTAWNAQTTMLQWLVTSMTDSRTLLGAVLFVQGAVVFAVSPLAGVAVDRLPRRRILILGRLGLGAVTAGLAGLVYLDVIVIWHVMVSVGLAGVITAIMQPATQTYVFDVVPRERAQNAVALNATASGIAHTVGPLLGGALIAGMGFVVAYLTSSVLVAIAAGLLLLVPVAGQAREAAAPTAWVSDLREGLAYVRGNPPVALALVVATMAIFNGATVPMRPIFARHILDVGSEGYGLMVGMGGLGGLATAIVMAFRPTARRPGVWILGSMFGYSATILAYSFAFSFEYILLVEFVMGICGQLWNVYTFAGLQMAVPADMRGRVVSLVFMIVMLAPMGGLAIGMLADAIGDQLALGLFGAAPLACMGVIWLFGRKQLRAL